LVIHPHYPLQRLSFPPDHKQVVITLEAVPPPLPPEPPEAQPTVIEAERLFYDQKRDVYHAEGTVVVTREGNLLTADEVEVKRKEEKMDALGKVTFRRADGDVIHGDKMSMSLAGKTGVLEQGQVFIKATHFYIRGNRLEKTGDDTYYGDRVVATTCDGDDPDWWVQGREMNVTLDGSGTVKDACFYAKKIPLLYTPYFLFPAKTTRQTGFLLPHRFAFRRMKLGVDVRHPFFLGY